MATNFIDRRSFVQSVARFGVASTVFPAVLYGMAEQHKKIDKQMVADAAAVVGLDFDDKQIDMMVDDLNQRLRAFDAIHDLHIANDVSPALVFDPVLPGMNYQQPKRPMRISRIPAPGTPKNIEDVAFYSVRQLAELVRTKKVSSVALTDMYLGRLKKYDPALKFVVNLTEDRARAQAQEADRDIASGKYRGPLHGLPWGAKDLLATKKYKTTWGAGGFEDQMIDEDATVVQRLDKAGAVLVAKLTLGALAQGDVWYGGMTRNPWKTDQGSSGSSAGPASATAAGCVAFAIGSETLGSISSPSTRCGTTGLRPTFGRVPRTGAMALSWSMDKLGPICRSAEDCALVLDAIHGPDGQDLAVREYPFNWDATVMPSRLRIGYVKSAFDLPERDPANAERVQHATKVQDDAALEVLARMGATLIPVELPQFPVGTGLILQPEAGAAFETLVLSGRVKEMVQQTPFAWPNTFRSAQFVPAVDYINANRARQLLMRRWDFFKNLDVIVTPTSGAGQLQQTNLTGNPAVIVPNGFREAPPLGPGTSATPVAPPRPDSSRTPADTGRREQPATPSSRPQTPVSLTFLGPLYQEDKPLALAHAYQQATDFHRRKPPGF